MTTPEGGLEAIDTYFRVIQSDDLAALKNADGMLDGILYPPDEYGHEVMTAHVVCDLEKVLGVEHDYGDMLPDMVAMFKRWEAEDRDRTHWVDPIKPEKRLKLGRIAAVTHVVHGTILGNVIDTNDFDHIIHGAVRTAGQVEGRQGRFISRRTRETFRRQIDDAGLSNFAETGSLERTEAAKSSFNRAHRFGLVAVNRFQMQS